MKRSEINAALREMEAMAERCRFPLPPFCVQQYCPLPELSLGTQKRSLVTPGFYVRIKRMEG